jgi:hypothetical protein
MTTSLGRNCVNLREAILANIFSVDMGCQCSKHEKLYEERIDGDCFVDLIKRQIADYPVLLYSRTICPSSCKVKQLLRKHGVQFEYFELDNMSKI